MFKGVVVAFLDENGVFNGQLSQKYKLLDKVLVLTNVFEQKSCIRVFILKVPEGIFSANST